MREAEPAIRSAERKLQNVARPAAPWIEGLARAGYAARGFVYLLVGALALMAARRPDGRASGTHGALRFIAEHHFGWVLIAGLCAGMAGFAVWSFARGLLDPEHFGSDLRGIARRIGFIFTGFIYCGLCVGTARFLLQSRRGSSERRQSDEHATREWTATLMAAPMGRWAVAAIGVGILVFAMMQVRTATRSDVDDPVRVGPMARRWIRGLARLGIIARGVVFVPIGIFLVVAAYRIDAREARGLGGSLATLRNEPAGRWLLVATAIGLVAFGLYQWGLARYRWIRAKR